MGSRLALGLLALLVVGCATDCEVVTAEDAAPLYFASDSEEGAHVEVVFVGKPTLYVAPPSSATIWGLPITSDSTTVWFSMTTSGAGE